MSRTFVSLCKIKCLLNLFALFLKKKRQISVLHLRCLPHEKRNKKKNIQPKNIQPWEASKTSKCSDLSECRTLLEPLNNFRFFFSYSFLFNGPVYVFELHAKALHLLSAFFTQSDVSGTLQYLWKLTRTKQKGNEKVFMRVLCNLLRSYNKQ